MSISEKVDGLIRALTLEEKASLCSGQGPWKTQAVPRLGIPPMVVTDGPHGVRLAKDPDQFGVLESVPATCFPTASALAASWDRELVSKVGRALAQECKALGVHVLLGPGVNMKRSPLGGRNFEYYSEDPFLSGALGTAYVNAVQGEGIGTSVKHFAANNQEFERMTISSEVDERVFREIYLAAFELIVRKARPWTVMCAYNKINGTYASENHYLLTEILRDEWGFEGFVVSDWGAVNDRVEGLRAGLDLEMPGPSPLNDRKLVEAVQSGDLPEAVLDEAVRRNLTVLFKALDSSSEGALDVEGHHRLAREAAAESMVLLKNEAGLLPLDPKGLTSLAVIGLTARTPRIQGGGSSKVKPSKLDVPLEEVKAALGETTQVSYAPGYPDTDAVDKELIAEAVQAAKGADRALLFVGLPDRIESEGYDRVHMNLPENQIQLIQAVAAVQPNTVVILSNGSAVTMTPWIEEVPAVLEAWLGGQGSGGAVADILFGKTSPSGKLSETFPGKLSDNPSYLNFPGENGRVVYGEGLFIGYRYYDKKEIEPLFPFGYGLSYTTFAYDNMVLDQETMTDTDTVQVSVAITNTGKRTGKEIVQLYVRPHQSQLMRPEKELKGFAKVGLEPGERRVVTFSLEARDFSYYDPAKRAWMAETGEYDILIGASSRDIRLVDTVHLESSQHQGPVLTKESSLKDWLEDEAGRAVLMQAFPAEQMGTFADPSNEFYDLLVNIPLKKLVSLSQGMVTDEMLDRLVQAVQKR